MYQNQHLNNYYRKLITCLMSNFTLWFQYTWHNRISLSLTGFLFSVLIYVDSSIFHEHKVLTDEFNTYCRHQHQQPSKKIMTFMQGTTSSRTSITTTTTTLGSAVTRVTSYPLWWAPECPRYLPLPSPWISPKPLHLGNHQKT